MTKYIRSDPALSVTPESHAVELAVAVAVALVESRLVQTRISVIEAQGT